MKDENMENEGFVVLIGYLFLVVAFADFFNLKKACASNFKLIESSVQNKNVLSRAGKTNLSAKVFFYIMYLFRTILLMCSFISGLITILFNE